MKVEDAQKIIKAPLILDQYPNNNFHRQQTSNIFMELHIC